MRVCFVSPQVPSGAYGRRGFSFLKQLSESGHEVTLHCIRDPGPVRDAEEALEALGIRVRSVVLPRVKRWRRCLAGWFGEEPLRILHCASGTLEAQLLEDLRGNPPEVLHVDRFRMAPYAIAARQVYSGPVIVDFPDALSLYYERAIRHPVGRLKGWIDRREHRLIPPWEANLLATGFHHVVCSEVDRQALLKHGVESSIHVLPHTVDTDDFQPRARGDGSVRGVFTGTLYYLPNMDALLWYREEIQPLLGFELPIEVVGFGATRELDEVRRDARYHFTGYVERMSDHLFEEDIYLCPLRIAAGVRNKLLEAFAAGMAVVSTSIGHEGIECRHGEHLLVADTAEEFARAVRRLAEDPSERARLGRNARELACRVYSPRTFAGNVEALYQESVRSHP
ncbi:MAG: hypothetical protein GHCLOJNM_04575 [bacterium]|nr:hypothetical protein [bacterium]